MRKDLPWRKRVEVLATCGESILCGFYDNDGTLGFFGGGVDSDETSCEAAVREFSEEAGGILRMPRVLQAPPLHYRWVEPFVTPEQKKRATKYLGSLTVYVHGVFDSTFRLDPLEPSHLLDVSLRPITEVVRLLTGFLETTEGRHRTRVEYRLQAAKALEASLYCLC